MAYVIPTDAHMVGDPQHTPDHNNITDVLGLLVSIAAQGAGPAAVRSSPPSGNAAAITALQTMLTWAGTGIGSGYFPWQFPVEAYGAKGNGKIITDAAMTSGQNLLNSAAQANFTSADIGKSVLVSCAGGGTYSPLGSTTSAACKITAVNSATQAVLSVNATSTTPGNSICGYATDDSAAINAAVAAATSYAQANSGYAEVIFSNTIYGLGGTYSPVNYQAGLGNSLIPLPIISPTAQKILVVFTGPTKTLDQALMHWLQLTPQASSSVLMVLRSDGTNNGTYGPASAIGSPFDGYGGDLGLFSNIMPVVDGLQVVVPYNSTYGGFDFFGCAEAVVINGSCTAMAVVNYGNTGSAPFPNISTYTNLTNAWPAGLRMPCTGNNDRCDVFSWSCEGLYYGIMPSEHSFVTSTRNIYCYYGVMFYSGNNVAMPHAARMFYVSVEASFASVGFFDGSVNMDIDTLDSELSQCSIYDPSDRGIGTISFRYAPPGVAAVGSIYNGATQIKPVSLDNAALLGVQVSGAPAPPSSGSYQVNTYFRDAIVYVTATGGITVVAVGGVTITGLTAGSSVTIPVPVPAGRTYTLTYSGTLTTQWWLS